MKKILSIIFCVILFLSCDSFLEEESQDQVIPNSARDFKEFLFGEAYLGKIIPPDYYLDVMTDDVSEFVASSSRDYRLDYYGYYAWQREPEKGLGDAVKNDMSWGKYYHQILMSNIVLNLIDKAEGTEEEIADVKGEAYYIRANAYFMLVNIYGEPYVKGKSNTSLGVPINDNIGVKDIVYKRSSVEEVYVKIAKDIENSIKYLKQASSKKTVFRISEVAANLLASRIYLYKKDWDNSIRCANRVIEINPALCDLNEYKESNIIRSVNPEILFTYGNNTTGSMYNKYGKVTFAVSANLLALYAKNDIRKSNYFYFKYSTKPAKGFTFTDIYGFALRTSEAYLNRAEAYAEKLELNNALSDINKIRENRLSAKVDDEDSVVTIDIVDPKKDEVISIVRKERRRELCFEQQRWFDLRRWGMPKIEHIWTTDLTTKATVTHILKQGDAAYTLPIPLDVRLSNPSIKRINRADR